ncbi:MAG: CPBP family glutamic-type intramembrane protease [Steroidobacteraceae bacterium]
MRAVLWFLAAIFGTLVIAALVAWPVWLLAHSLEPDWAFHRIVSRFWQVLLLIGLLLALRKLGLRGRADWGYGLPRRLFLRHLAVGLAIGVATMLPMTLAMCALGIVELRLDFAPPMLLEVIAAAAMTGLAVAIVEETFFRGLMFRAVSRESGFNAAAWSTALVYSAIHFLARARIPEDQIQWDSGLRLLGGALAHFAEPAAIADSFVTLVLVGLLLAFVRQRTGAIAAGIGLHMGWVWVIKSSTAITRVDDEARWSFLVGSFDGYTGWLVAAWAALMIAVAWICGWLRPTAAAAR